MSINWYAHHLGDYSKHTKELTMLEHGAYRLLMDYYYTKEGPFANDLPTIYRACSAHTPTERRAIQKVLSKYFTPGGGVWCHPRCDDEIKRSCDRSKLGLDLNNQRWKKASGTESGTQSGTDSKPTTYNQQPYINNTNGKGNGYAKQKTGTDEGNRLAEKIRGAPLDT